MSIQPTTFLTPEQYLEIERKAECKSEYYRGEMFAMSGASRAHILIVGNLFAALHAQLRSGPCETYANEMRVCVSATGLYTYPDVVVVCGEPRLADAHVDTLLNPTLVIEVLSPSTEAHDRGRKFDHYQSIETLREYLLVASDRIHMDLYTRQEDSRWLLTTAEGPSGTLELSSIKCRFLLSDIYERVEFEGAGR